MNVIDRIRAEKDISREHMELLLTTQNKEAVDYMHACAREVAKETYGNKIFMRGLIEISSYCKNDCLYCGLRKSNGLATRYRLSEEQILSCCEEGYGLGFRTFVLQGGEDPWYTDERMCHIVMRIRERFADCAITLSLGERGEESYRRLFAAGANRYLLRHETALEAHYEKLHPTEMSWRNRMDCLQTLKEIGFQVGCGFMVGSPYQTLDTLYADLQFIRNLQPAMVGIGPFIPAGGTPFADYPAGSVETTLRLLSIIRLLHPHVLLPATTALGTLHPQGRELGIMSGANVVMPNLSPKEHRKDYSIYDNKLSVGDEAAESRNSADEKVRSIGYETVVDRGDYRR